MGTRPDDSKKTAVRALRGRNALLAAWLDVLNQFDGPSRRRAAELRQAQQLRRDNPIRRLPARGPQLRALVHPTKRVHTGIGPASTADGGSAFGRWRTSCCKSAEQTVTPDPALWLDCTDGGEPSAATNATSEAQAPSPIGADETATEVWQIGI